MRAVPLLCIIHYTLAFVLRLSKNHGKTCQGSRKVPYWAVLATICLVDLAAVLRAISTGLLAIITLGLCLRWRRPALGQRKSLPSCRTKGFPASPGLMNFLYGAGNIGRICPTCGQHEIQYTERNMIKYMYDNSYNFTRVFVCTWCTVE